MILKQNHKLSTFLNKIFRIILESKFHKIPILIAVPKKEAFEEDYVQPYSIILFYFPFLKRT